MHSVSSLALSTDEAAKKTHENPNTYISLPRLFNLPLENIRHSIVLKNTCKSDNNTIESKVVLLTTEVESETEIPDEKIFPLPKVFEGMSFSRLFSGIQLDPSPCLLLNPERLLQSINEKEFTV